MLLEEVEKVYKKKYRLCFLLKPPIGIRLDIHVFIAKLEKQHKARL